MNKSDINFFTETLNNLFPNATTELYFNNDFQLLIAIIMSAQATDKQVNKVNKNLFTILKSPKDGEKIWLEKLKKHISSISFFNNKSKHILETCKILDKLWQIPKNIDDLMTLPWVWIKTAKVFLAVVENAPYIWVDTHVHRVLNRLWFVNTKTPEQTDKKISNYFTKQNHAELHNTLVLFWRYYCMARKPKCKNCVFKNKCKYFGKLKKH